VFTTGRACTPSSDIKGGYCLVLETAPIRSTDASCAQWWLTVIARCPINAAGCRRTWLIDSRKQPISATDSGVACTTPFVPCFTLSFANGRIFSHGPWKATVGIGSVLNRRFGGGRFYWIGPSNFGWIVRPLIVWLAWFAWSVNDGECWLAIFRQTDCALTSGRSSFGLGLNFGFIFT